MPHNIILFDKLLNNNLDSRGGWYDDLATKVERVCVSEREIIDRKLGGAGVWGQVYGFNTLLGELDDRRLQEEEKKGLLEGHLHGDVQYLSVELSKTLVLSKLIQISNGGTGVTFGTARKLLDYVQDSNVEPLSTNFLLSYSSADVTPASQLLQPFLRPAEQVPDGDLIAMISGNFMSLGLTVYCLAKIKRLVPQFYYSWKNLHGVLPGHFQNSVLLRDLDRIVEDIQCLIGDVEKTVDAAYDIKSANPLFATDSNSGQFEPKSQSSFLNFRLTSYLLMLQETLVVIADVTQRVADVYVSNDHDTNNVQIPKIIRGLADHVRSNVWGGGTYTGSLSEGLEDLWDFSLLRAKKVYDSIKILEQINMLI